MYKTLAIAKVEYKTQVKSAGFWLVLFISAALAIVEGIPLPANLQRLSALTNSGYAVSHMLLSCGLLLLFGNLFLISGRIRIDIKTGMAELFKAAPIGKSTYIIGKYLGCFASVMTASALLLTAYGIAYTIFLPASFSIVPYFKAFFILLLPAVSLVTGCALALPAWIGSGAFYALASGYFLMNVICVPDATHMPAYLLLSNELIKTVYPYGLGVVDILSQLFCGVMYPFIGLMAITSLGVNRKLWREPI